MGKRTEFFMFVLPCSCSLFFHAMHENCTFFVRYLHNSLRKISHLTLHISESNKIVFLAVCDITMQNNSNNNNNNPVGIWCQKDVVGSTFIRRHFTSCAPWDNDNNNIHSTEDSNYNCNNDKKTTTTINS